jgi:hypothetical protein
MIKAPRTLHSHIRLAVPELAAGRLGKTGALSPNQEAGTGQNIGGGRARLPPTYRCRTSVIVEVVGDPDAGRQLTGPLSQQPPARAAPGARQRFRPSQE